MITIDHVLQSVEGGVIDIRGFVSEMRKQRNYMVQTEVMSNKWNMCLYAFRYI